MTGGNLQCWIAVSFGLLCALQAVLNICLRLMIYNEAPNVQDSCNTTTERNTSDKLEPYFQQGWIHFHSSLYYLSSVAETWDLGREFCQLRGADLVVINTRAEQNFVGKFNKVLWIGLRDKRSNRRWTWVDGTALTESYWLQNEPNNFDGKKEDCVEVYNTVDRKGWNDLPCKNENFYLCEKTIIG